MRAALKGLSRFIGTPYTAKYRPFIFVDAAIVPDAMVYAIASDDAVMLGYLSSTIHSTWAKSAGGTLEDRPRYNSNGTFLPFPFPALEEGPLKQRIRDLGERLDAHRKARQAAHPELTLTGLYNVLEKLRAGEPLTDKDKKIHDDGLVTILKQIHDELDEAVLEAYGWGDVAGTALRSGPANAMPMNEPKESPADKALDTASSTHSPGPPGGRSLPIADILARGGEQAEALEQELLTRLVALNHERAAEEQRGLIRWLRPEYQAPDSKPQPQQKEIDLGEASSQSKINNPQSTIVNPPAQAAWPSALSAQVTAIQKLLPATGPDPAALAGHFGKRSKVRVQQITEILKTLEGLGKL
jgi:hypothetical protein